MRPRCRQRGKYTAAGGDDLARLAAQIQIQTDRNRNTNTHTKTEIRSSCVGRICSCTGGDDLAGFGCSPACILLQRPARFPCSILHICALCSPAYYSCALENFPVQCISYLCTPAYCYCALHFPAVYLIFQGNWTDVWAPQNPSGHLHSSNQPESIVPFLKSIQALYICMYLCIVHGDDDDDEDADIQDG